MRLVIQFSVAFVLASSADAQRLASIHPTLVKKIESSMVMPPRSGPMASFSRLYEIIERDGRRLVQGVYLRGVDDYDEQRSLPVTGVEGAFVMKPGERAP